MKCIVCGAELRPTRTDLPFKVSDSAIVIFKGLPVLQCAKCPEYLLEDGPPAGRRASGADQWRDRA